MRRVRLRKKLMGVRHYIFKFLIPWITNEIILRHKHNSWLVFKKMMQKERRGREFEIPSLLKFLSSHPELELIVSDITRVGIFRYLISEWGCNLESCGKAWDYIESFEIEVIKAEINFEELDLS